MSRLDLHFPRTGVASIRKVRFTLAFLMVMLVANAAAGTFSGQIDPHVLAARGIGVDAMKDGNLMRLLTAIFLSHDLPMLLRQLAFTATVIGATELLWGTRCALGLFFGIDVTATIILLATVALLPDFTGLATTTDVGMSMGGFGLIGVLIAAHRNASIWLVVLLGLIATKFAVALESLAFGGHVIALIIGFGVGWYLPRRPGHDIVPAPARNPRRSNEHMAEAHQERYFCTKQQDGRQ
ncbi:MAG: hypothetical protein ACU0FH_17320 [Heliomarina sp.]|uniref:hypothetical protein n=1 Tax=Heliomarina sp. TaxID=2917556 RepID=UPI0040580E3D